VWAGCTRQQHRYLERQRIKARSTICKGCRPGRVGEAFRAKAVGGGLYHFTLFLFAEPALLSRIDSVE
jgi:hypothetical protein